MAEKSLKKNAFYSVISSTLSLLFPVITFPYASRILGPESIGKVNFANSVVSYFLMIAGLGIQGYAAREAAKVRHDKIALTRLVKEILIINSISTIISYVSFTFLFFLVPKFYGYRTLLIICSLKILFTSIGIDWLYTALEEFKYTTIRSFIFQIISLIFLFTFVQTENHTVFYAIFGIISAVGSKACNLIHSRRYVEYVKNIDLKPTKHLKSIMVFTGMSFVTSVYTMLDSTMLGFLSTDIQIGYYSAANKLNHMVLSILTSLTAVLLPRFAVYAANEQKNSFNELAQKSFSTMLLLSIPMATGLFLLARPLTLIFSGSKYLPAVLPMQVITPIVCAIPLASITAAQMLPALNKEKLALISYIIASLLNVVCNFIFIPKYGALGAALGTVAAEVGGVLIQIAFLHRIIFVKTIFINLFHALTATFFMFVILHFYMKAATNIILQTASSVIIGILVYALVLLLLRNKLFIETKNMLLGKFLKKKN